MVSKSKRLLTVFTIILIILISGLSSINKYEFQIDITEVRHSIVFKEPVENETITSSFSGNVIFDIDVVIERYRLNKEELRIEIEIKFRPKIAAIHLIYMGSANEPIFFKPASTSSDTQIHVLADHSIVVLGLNHGWFEISTALYTANDQILATEKTNHWWASPFVQGPNQQNHNKAR